MSQLNRRQFLDRTQKAAAGVAAGVTILKNSQSVSGAPAADKVVLASVGVRGRGAMLAQGFIERGDCEIAYVCDVDSALFASRAKQITEQQGREPQCVQDFRKALDDKNVDAIISATPDHWHALSSVWACQAGKDVYVEKPATHSAWEGRKMVEAARKYNRIVEIGTQCRSGAYCKAARKYIEDGKLGQIHMCRVYNQKIWANQPKKPDSDPPAGLDWDRWVGPAPEHPYNVNHHSYWNHIWNYSGGDIANDASHQIDLARWVVGVKYPTTAYSVGGRFNSEGAAETPDTQVAVWEFPGMLMTFELTLYTPYMLKSDMAMRDLDIFPYWPQNGTRIEIYGSEALMVLGRHGDGWQVFDRQKNRQPVVKDEMHGPFPDKEHKEDFIQAVRTRRRPAADVEEGHLSALLIHTANISYRLGGQKLRIDAQSEQIIDNAEAMKLYRREYRAPYVIPDEV